jgi:hypothetical protein
MACCDKKTTRDYAVWLKHAITLLVAYTYKWIFRSVFHVCSHMWVRTFRAIWHRHMLIFGFTTIWHRQNVTALVLCWRLAERAVTVVPSVTCMHWLHWWHKHAAGVVPASSTLAFAKKMNEKCNLLNLVQSKWKIIDRQSVLKRN